MSNTRSINMNTIIVSSLSTFLIFVIFNLGSVSSSVAMGIDKDSREITCTGAGVYASKINEITLQSRENALVVTMDKTTHVNATVLKDSHHFIQKVEGKIDNEDVSNSYLTVTLWDLSSRQNGGYDCIFNCSYKNIYGSPYWEIVKDVMIWWQEF